MQASLRKTSGKVGRKLHAILISGQIVLVMMLLTAAATAIGSFRVLLRADLGFDPNHIIDFPIPVHSGSYTTWEARSNYFGQLRDRVRQTPSVTSTSLGVIGPPYSEWDFRVEILGRNEVGSQICNINFVDSEFFRLFGVSLLQGRLWDETESTHGARLAIVNESFRKRYFPNRDVLGHSVRVPDLSNHPPGVLAVSGSNDWAQIIGIVGDARNNGLDEPVKPEIYFPYSLYMIDWVQIFVRAQGDPMALETVVRRQVAKVNPGQQISAPVVSMRENIERQPEWVRGHLVAVLSSVFSILALILASVGLYSVVSYSVTQRINEFGIRMAVGAQRRHIVLNVLATVGVSVRSGLVVGLVVSVGLHKLLSHWLENVVSNILTVIGVCLILIMVSFVACIVPAVRASMLKPMKALRVE
jgi:predicted permease